MSVNSNKKRKVKWLIGIASLLSFFVFMHVILNSQSFQLLAVKSANRIFGIEVKWDNLYFNGATGYYSGEKLIIDLPQKNTQVKLDNFEFSIDPFRLLVGTLKIDDLKADNLFIRIDSKEITLPSTQTKLPKRQKDFSDILDHVKIQNARISKIEYNKNDEKMVSATEVTLRQPPSLFFGKNTYQANIKKLNAKTPKLDLFSDEIEITGSIKVDFNEDAGKNKPHFDGSIDIKNTLIGIIKKPNTWNPQPAWDSSLDARIKPFYPEGIPETRVFAWVDHAFFSGDVSDKKMVINDSILEAFNGLVSINGAWLPQKGTLDLRLKTQKPISPPLLPLGKTKFRLAYDKADLDISANGTFFNPTKGSAKMEIKAHLFENRNILNGSDIELAIAPKFNDGKFTVPEINLRIGTEKVAGFGQINLATKTLGATFSGKNLDSQSVIRLFSDIDVPGLANVDGSISGELANPTFNLKLSSPGFGYESLWFGTFDGQLIIKNQDMSLNGKSLLAGAGSGEINLLVSNVFKSNETTTRLKTSFNNLPAHDFLKTDAVTQGKVTGFFNINKHLADLSGEGKIDASDILWYKVPVSHIAAAMTVKGPLFAVAPIDILLPDGQTIKSPTGLKFNTYYDGFDLTGTPIPNVNVTGNYKRTTPESMQLSVKTTGNVNVDFLSPMIPLEIKEFSVAGNADITYHFQKPLESKFNLSLTHFNMQGENTGITISHPTTVKYDNMSFGFDNTDLLIGKNKLRLSGELNYDKNSSLKMDGSLELENVAVFIPTLIDGSGAIDTQLVWTGSINAPAFSGAITFKDTTLLPRGLAREMSHTQGKLTLKGTRYEFNNIQTSFDDAPSRLDGWIEWEASTGINAANLRISGQEIPLNKVATWRVLADSDLLLSGTGGSITLSGNMNVVDGLYYKDYSLSDFILKPVGVANPGNDDKKFPEYINNLKLNLKVKSTGDFVIRNNLADMILRSNLEVKGTIASPVIEGNVDVLEGFIHAFGIEFIDATGFAAFSKTNSLNPFIEFSASHDIQDYEIKAKLRGLLDNLSLTLESTPALNQNEIASLIAYGRTPDQLQDSQRNIFSTSAVASQIVGFLQRPLSQATKLDIMKIEAEYDPNKTNLSRISIGKKLSDRFSLAFTSDLVFDNSHPGFSLEYQLFDNLLLKAITETDSGFKFDLTWRLEGY